MFSRQLLVEHSSSRLCTQLSLSSHVGAAGSMSLQGPTHAVHTPSTHHPSLPGTLH